MKALMFLISALWVVMLSAAPIGLRHYQEPWRAPDFQLTDQFGISHSLADYRGKVLIVNFWATWCSPCVREMPALQGAWEILKPENILLVGIAVDEDSKDISRFLEKHQIGFPLLSGDSAGINSRWQIPGLPTTYVVNAAGFVEIRVIGPFKWDSPDTLQKLRAFWIRTSSVATCGYRKCVHKWIRGSFIHPATEDDVESGHWLPG